MNKKLTVTGTGDSLFVADIPNEYFEGDFKPVYDYINSCDVKMTNLETNVSKFGDFPNAYSGGTWLNTEPEVFDDLAKYGFNYYGTANNHCMDYSYHGMLSTISELDKRGLAHSGTGKNLEEASAPAIINADGKKIAIFAVACEYSGIQVASRAGVTTNNMKGRPGVNYLGYTAYRAIGKEDLEKLKEIAKQTQINAARERSVAGGFALPDPDGVYSFGELKFCYDGSKKETECNKTDKERIINAIKQAKKENDYVFILIHCHDSKGTSHENVPDYYEDLAHACIDAGVSAVIGGGAHQLRPIEIYNGCPIFYSLGDFIYQGMRVPYLPADFMVKYGCDKNATAWEGLMARSKNNTIGLQVHKHNFMTVLPKMEFEDGKLVSLEMMPIVAGFKRKGKMDGLPYHAKNEESKEIFDVLDRLSTPYGTKIVKNGDMLKIEL
ncbi:MAG: CapA family protein [Clostridia bacterium]|nr:CapA family protein [Clostridia bacterium]